MAEQGELPTPRHLRRYALLAVAAVLIAAVAVVWTRVDASCPSDWSDAQRIEMTGGAAAFTLDGTRYEVSASALLDYMPHSGPPSGHPLSVVAHIGANSREALGDPQFTCVRVTHGEEVWARRPSTYEVTTLADGYPPGAPSPVPNPAGRMSARGDGPEWPAGDLIGLEVWVSVRGQHYTFVAPPFPLMKGA